MFPCNECAKIIIQSGVSEVIYFMEKRSEDTKIAYVASEKLLSMAGIKVRRHQPQMDKILIKFKEQWKRFKPKTQYAKEMAYIEGLVNPRKRGENSNKRRRDQIGKSWLGLCLLFGCEFENQKRDVALFRQYCSRRSTVHAVLFIPKLMFTRFCSRRSYCSCWNYCSSELLREIFEKSKTHYKIL